MLLGSVEVPFLCMTELIETVDCEQLRLQEGYWVGCGHDFTFWQVVDISMLSWAVLLERLTILDW